MNSVVAELQHGAVGPLGTVIHVGAASPDDVDAHTAHAASRVVLVCCDSEAATEIRASAAHQRGIDVLDAVVGARPGQGHWRRFNVSELNGLLVPAGLRRIFPRLQEVDRTPVGIVDLQSVLQGVKLERQAGRSNALLLDIPGLEASILQSVTPETLRSFDLIALRSCAHGLYEGADAVGTAVAWLRERFYKIVHEGSVDPLWSTTLLARDAQAQAMAEATQRAKALEEQLAAALRKAQDATEQAAQLTAQHELELKALTAKHNEQAKLATERIAQIDHLEAELNDLSARFTLLQEELIKAEAHVELISDLLLRDAVR